MSSRGKWLIGLTALAVVLSIGIWQSWPQDADDSLPSPEQQAEQLKGAPPRLAALHAQAGELIEGDIGARLRQLRGIPVVVNMWASWCGPCRAELPVLGRVAVAEGKRVAFLGLNSKDKSRKKAEELLAEFPQSYPSYVDEDHSQARKLGFLSNFPSTAFVDARGEVAYLHQGQYVSEADLQADIAKYLGGAQ